MRGDADVARRRLTRQRPRAGDGGDGRSTQLDRRHAPEAQFGDYVALLKPRVMRLVVFTALVGLVAAPVPCIR